MGHSQSWYAPAECWDSWRECIAPANSIPVRAVTNRNSSISLAALPPDQKLRKQMIDVRYSITEAGDIKVESKQVMKKRGNESPDRADGVMYAFSLVEELPTPVRTVETPVLDHAGLPDRSPEAMWRRDFERLKSGRRDRGRTPWDPVPPGMTWDDL